MPRARDLATVLEGVKGPVALILGDGLCSEPFLRWVAQGDVDPCRELSDEEALRYVKRVILEKLDVECLVTVCVDEMHRRVLGKHALALYGSCSSGLSREVSKHRVDEFLKCLASVETVIALCLRNPLSIVSEAIVVASSMGRDVVIVSDSVPRELLNARRVGYVEFDCSSLSRG